MSRKASVRNLYSGRRLAIGLVAVMLLGFAAAFNYVAQATVRDAMPPPHTRIAVPPGILEDDWSGGPRECDILNGITTSCIFPD